MKSLLTWNILGKPARHVLLSLVMAVCHGLAVTSINAATQEPAITNIAFEGKDVLITVQVPPGLTRITLQSSQRLGTGVWEPRAVWRLDGQGGEVTFRVARSPELEIVRVRADETEPLPASFYQGTKVFPGTGTSTMVGAPPEVFFGTVDNRASDGDAAAAPRDVVESDIWKVEGDVLYFFNQYRGLQVVDVANPDAPTLRGTLALTASGEQMYVLPGKEVVLLARDGCNWGPDSGSQVLIVGTADGLPKIVTSLPVSGEIQESRMVGSALYVMTQTYRPMADSKEGAWEWGTSIYSFDLSNPSAPVAHPNLWFAGYGNVLSATDSYLFISVQNNSNRSTVNCIDISSPDGTLQKAGVIQAAGHVKDKFKMSLYESVLTIISEVWLQTSPDSRGQTLTKLETFSLTDPLLPKKMGELELAAGEQLHATRFDGNRVYVVTYFRIDPLWVVDLSDPTRPAIRGELKVPGWSTYIQPLGDRLLAIGIDDTNGWRVAVSLFDVKDPTAPSLLSKVPLGENSSWSEANSDEKAFGYLPEAGLILVPYSTYSTKQEQGVQLIDLTGNTLIKRGFIAHEVQARRSTLHRDRILSISGRNLLTVDASDRDKPIVRSETELSWSVNRVFIHEGYLIQLENGHGGWGESLKPALRVARASAPDKILNELLLKDLPVAGATMQGGRLYLLQGSTTYYPPVLAEGETVKGEEGTNLTTYLCSVLDLANLPALELVSSSETTSNEAFGGTADPVWPKSDLLVWVSQQGAYWPRWLPVLDMVGGISTMPVRGGFDFWMPYGSGQSSLLAVDAANPQSLRFVSKLTLTSTNGWANFSKAFAVDNLVYVGEQFTESWITGTNYYVYTNAIPVIDTNPVVIGDGKVAPDSDVTEVRFATDPLKTPEFTFTVVTNEQPIYTSRQVSRLHVVDYSVPNLPLARRPVEVPGSLQGLSHKGSMAYFLGRKIDTTDTEDYSEWLHGCAYDGVACYLVDSLALPKDWPHTVLVREPHVFVSRPEVEKVSTRALEVWSVSDAGKFAKQTERQLASNAYAVHAVGDFLAVQEDTGIELFNLTQPTELPLVGAGRPDGCLGWNIEHAFGTFQDGFWIPLDAYGAHQIDVKR